MGEKERWNQAAAHYQSISRQNTGYQDKLVNYLKEKGAVGPGLCVADIGCGPGKYAMRFAAEGCSLVLTDFAEKMLDFARANLADFDVPCRYVEGDFKELSLEALGGPKSVDLAYASMTPGVKDDEQIRKMCELSRRHCFLSKFSYYDNLMQDAVCEALGAVSRDHFSDGFRFPDFVESVRTMGYEPEVLDFDRPWENILTLEEAEKAFFDGRLERYEDTEEMHGKVREALLALSQDGSTVVEHVNARSGWLYWTV